MNFWIGTSDDFDNPAYWTDGIPTPEDIITFNGPAGPISTTIDGDGSPTTPPPSGPQPYSLSNLTFPEVGDENYEPAYAGIRVINGYSGVVTFPANVDFGEYKQTTGSTAQFANTALTVTSSFLWTGGAVNATTNTATYNIIGVSSAQFGTDTTTLSSGSNIVLNSGTEANLAGVVNLPTDRHIEVLEFADLNFRRIQAALPPGGNEPKTNRVFVKKGAARVFDNTTIDSLVVEQGGRVTINAEKRLTVESTIPNSQLVGVKMDEGQLTIGRDGELRSTSEVYLVRSALVGVPDGDKDTSDTFTITGDLGISERFILLTPVNVVDCRKLVITGDAKFNDGTFKAGVDADANQKNDVIQAKTFITSSEFVIDVTPKDGTFTAGTNWDVLVSINGFQNETDIPKAKQPGYTTRLVEMKKHLRVQG